MSDKTSSISVDGNELSDAPTSEFTRQFSIVDNSHNLLLFVRLLASLKSFRGRPREEDVEGPA